MEQALLSFDEACNSLRIGRTQMYKFINAGHIKVRKMGSKTVFTREDIAAFIETLDEYKPKGKV